MTHAHLKAIMTKAAKQRETSRPSQDKIHLNIQLLDGAVLINGKKHNLPVTKEYILKEYNDVFCGIGTLPGDEYHIKLKKNYEPVKYSPRPFPIKLKLAYKEELQQLYSGVSSHQYGSTLNGPAP